jgi:clan AA aspartic protease
MTGEVYGEPGFRTENEKTELKTMRRISGVVRLPPEWLVPGDTREKDMSIVHTEITLVNVGDLNDANRGYIPQEQIRQVTVNALVDTGAWTLVINEKIREKLGLRVEEATEATLAGGGRAACGKTEAVEVHWQDRKTTCNAVVLPGEDEILLGALPLEGMDLKVNPLRQEVVGAHGDTVRIVIK